MRVHIRTENSSRVERARILAHALAGGRVECAGPGPGEPAQPFADPPAPPRLDEAIELCERVLDVLGEGLFIADLAQPGTPIVYVNQAFERLTGYSLEDLMGRTLASLQGPDSDPTAFADLQSALQNKGAWSGELLAYRKDGTPGWYELRLVPIPDGGGPVQYGLGIVTDVTGRKDLQERFRQAQKMAALGYLAGGIAHDFNNMLTAILAFSDILLAAPLPPDVRAGLAKIREAGERGAMLTSQLLAFSRKRLPTPRPVDLRLVLSEMSSLLRRLIGEEIDLVTVVDPALAPLKLVPGQVEQILLNLVVNARDAMPAGGAITIELAAAQPDPHRVRGPGTLRPGPYLLLAVTDTGCGMKPEVLAELFKPHFTTKEPGQGTGLGLFMVHEIVKQNDGLIAVASQPGQGTRVEIFLPCNEDPPH